MFGFDLNLLEHSPTLSRGAFFIFHQVRGSYQSQKRGLTKE